MAHKHHNAVNQAALLLEATKAAVKTILADPELQVFKMKIVSSLNKATQSLVAITGGMHIGSGGMDSEVTSIMQQLKPLNSIGGEPIDRQAPVTPEVLDVSVADRERFIELRTQLSERFKEMTDDQVYAFMKQPMGEAIVRSLGKVVGHPAWQTAEIDGKFLQEMRDQIEFQETINSTVGMAVVTGANTLGKDDEDGGENDSSNVRTGAPEYDFKALGAGATGQQQTAAAGPAALTPAQEEQLAALQAQFPDEYLGPDRDLDDEWPSPDLRIAYLNIYNDRMAEFLAKDIKGAAARTPAGTGSRKARGQQ